MIFLFARRAFRHEWITRRATYRFQAWEWGARRAQYRLTRARFDPIGQSGGQKKSYIYIKSCRKVTDILNSLFYRRLHLQCRFRFCYSTEKMELRPRSVYK